MTSIEKIRRNILKSRIGFKPIIPAIKIESEYSLSNDIVVEYIDKLLNCDLAKATKDILFYIFNQRWMDENKNIKIGIHPFADIIIRGFQHTVMNTICSFAKLFQSFDLTWFQSRDNIVKDLRNGEKFFNTLYELDMLAKLFCSPNIKLLSVPYATSRSCDVEAEISIYNDKYLVECKNLMCGEKTKEIYTKADILHSQEIIDKYKYNIWFDVFPTIEMIESLAVEVLAKAKNDVSFEIQKKGSYLLKYEYAPGKIGKIGEIRFAENVDDRIKTTLDKTIKKLKGVKTPVLLFINIDLAAGWGTTIRKLNKYIPEQECKKIHQVILTNRLSNIGCPYFEYDYVPIIRYNSPVKYYLTWNGDDENFIINKTK